MKVRVSNLLASFAAVFLMALSAQAQEELPVLEPQDPNHPSHQELNFAEDKILIYDQSNHSGQVKDTLQAAVPKQIAPHPTRTPKTDSHKNNQKEREGEEVLSFNFLYYMFQKFKMSDLIDQ